MESYMQGRHYKESRSLFATSSRFGIGFHTIDYRDLFIGPGQHSYAFSLYFVLR